LLGRLLGGSDLKERYQVWQSNKEVPDDIFSWSLKAIDENDQSAPPGEFALREDARLIIIAGR